MTLELNLDSLNINESLFIKHLYNNTISDTSKKYKLDYINNRNKYSNKNKEDLKSLLTTLKGGKVQESSYDMYTYFLVKMYDVVDPTFKKEIESHILKKIEMSKQQHGGLTFTDFITRLDDLTNSLKTDGLLTTSSQKNDLIVKLRKFAIEEQKLLAASQIDNVLDLGPSTKVMTITDDLKGMTDEEIKKYATKETFDSLVLHLGSLSNIKTNKLDDIKNIVNFLKTHSIFATNYLKNIVNQLDQASANKTVFDGLVQNVKRQMDNLIEIIKKIKLIKEAIKNIINNTKSMKDYRIYPLDVKIASNSYIEALFNDAGQSIKYTINPDAIKITFQKIPTDINVVIDKLTDRINTDNEKIPGSNNPLVNITNEEDLKKLLTGLKDNYNSVLRGGADDEADPGDFQINRPIMDLAIVDQKTPSLTEFNNMTSSRKKANAYILEVSALINQMDIETNKLVETVEEFNIVENREYYYSYVLSVIAMKSSGTKKYRFMSFGIIDFYRSIIKTIWEKIKIKNAPQKLKGIDSKFLFFYYFHYKIIQSLNTFLDKFFLLKDFNYFYVKNTYIEIDDCTGYVKQYLTLLNIYKYILDDFYSKIGLSNSLVNVSIYLKINDFPNEKLILGRQFGSLNKGSIIADDKAGSNVESGSAFMYNINFADPESLKYLYSDIDVPEAIKDLKNISDKSKKLLEPEQRLKLIWDNIMSNKSKYGSVQVKWQQYAGAAISELTMPDTASGEPSFDPEFYLNKEYNRWQTVNDEDNLSYGIPPRPTVYGFDEFKDEILYKTKSNVMEDIWKEREAKRFFLLNRKVNDLIEKDYSDDIKFLEINKHPIQYLQDKSINPNSDEYKIIKEYEGKFRPYIAKVAFLPLLTLIQDNSVKTLGLTDLKKLWTNNREQALDILFSTGNQQIKAFMPSYGTKVGGLLAADKAIWAFDQAKNSEDFLKLMHPNGKKVVDILNENGGFDLNNPSVGLSFNVEINNDAPITINYGGTANDKLNLYLDYFNQEKIYIPLIIGFLTYSTESTAQVQLNKEYKISDDNLHQVKGKLSALKIEKFKLSLNGSTNVVNSVIYFRKENEFKSQMILIPTTQENRLKKYHWILKNNFKTLFYEQGPYDRNESEMVFKAASDNGSLIVDNPMKCLKLLDRFTNEDDYVKLSGEIAAAASTETKFNYVFSNEKTPDNSSVGMFMSIPSKLSMGNGFMLLTFGYSGTGKTVTVFGNKDFKTNVFNQGVLQTALSEVEKEEDSKILFRSYEMYGIGLPYASYWYDKLGTDYDPKRVELLIHHRFNTDTGTVRYDSTNKLHVFTDEEQKKLYLNNNNWFFPDAGTGLYRTVSQSEFQKEKLPDMALYTGLSQSEKDLLLFGQNNTDIMYKEERELKRLDDAQFVGDDSVMFESDHIIPGASSVPLNKRIGYVRYDNKLKIPIGLSGMTDTKYLTPKTYSLYQDKDKIEQFVFADKKVTKISTTPRQHMADLNTGSPVPTSTSDNFATAPTFGDLKDTFLGEKDTRLKNSTYIELDDKNIREFSEVISLIDQNRKESLQAYKLNINEAPLPEYRNIRRIKETANNPESSRSVIFYEFVIKLKEPQRVKITDEYGRELFVWRHYVTLLIVDLPGQEDIRTSFVDKSKYDLTLEHKSTFNFPRKDPGTNMPFNSLDLSALESMPSADHINLVNTTYANRYLFTRPITDVTSANDRSLNNTLAGTGSDIYSNMLHDTRTDAKVYKYNQLLQKLIKSSVYLNPLFKFMSYIRPENFNNVQLNNPINFALGTSWSFTTTQFDLPIPPGAKLELVLSKYNDPSEIVYAGDIIARAKQNVLNDPINGSTEYRNNPNFIDGLVLIQTDPLKYINNYLLDILDTSGVDVEKVKADMLAPYEAITINNNVTSLIEYLYQKTIPKTTSRKYLSNKEQHYNIASGLFKNRVPLDIDGTQPSNIPISTLATTAFNTREANLGFSIGQSRITGVLNTTDTSDKNAILKYVTGWTIQNVVQNELYKWARLLVPGITAAIIDTAAKTINYNTSGLSGPRPIAYMIDGNVNTGMLNDTTVPMQNKVKLSKYNITGLPTGFTDLSPPYDVSKEEGMWISENVGPKDDWGYNTVTNPGIDITPTTISSKEDANYDDSATQIQHAFTGLRNSLQPLNAKQVAAKATNPTLPDLYNNQMIGLEQYWIDYYYYFIKYIMLIDIFIVHKQLRGFDRYYRERVIPKNTDGSLKYIAEDIADFNEWYKRLEDFYSYYINDYLTQKEGTTTIPIYTGIYSKNKLFRNNMANEFLKQLNIYFYKKKNDYSSKYLISSSENLQSTLPQYDMMHVKPLIYNYLEPYEPYFNTYSLLFIMSNNDPNIKCYKQMELLSINKEIISKIVQ